MNNKAKQLKRGFTLIEVLIVIAVISIFAAMVINTFSNAANDSREVVSRQQQAVVQSAVNNFISQAISGNNSVSFVRSAYNDLGGGLARLAAVSAYLDEQTYLHIAESSTASVVRSDAMKRVGKYLEIGTWSANSYPKVKLLP